MLAAHLSAIMNIYVAYCKVCLCLMFQTYNTYTLQLYTTHYRFTILPLILLYYYTTLYTTLPLQVFEDGMRVWKERFAGKIVVAGA